MLIGAAVLIIIRNYSRDEVLEYIFSIYSCVVIFSQLRQIGKKFELVTIYA